MKLKIDIKKRNWNMRAHTATHLLHWELNKIIKNTKQAGSLVDNDYIRFDFTCKKALSNKEIQQIEENINNIIYEWLSVNKKEMSLEQALQAWAKAFFEEKYWDVVRVISIWNWEKKTISIELCWWTHVDNTSQIWIFKIISQEAVSSWVRRIIAYTWTKVYNYIKEQDKLLQDISDKLDCTSKQIIEKLNKSQKELEQIKWEYESMKQNIVKSILENIDWESKEWFDKIINISKYEELNKINFKDILNIAKQVFDWENIIIYNNDWNFVIFTKNINAKEFAKSKWLKWWWTNNIIQGKDHKIKQI